MQLLNAAQMRELDRWAIEELGIPSLVLMENAGREVARVTSDYLRQHAEIGKAKVWIFCGSGNNGGDGFVAARHLLNGGTQVVVCLLGTRLSELKDDAATNANILTAMGLKIHEAFTAGDLAEAVREMGREPKAIIDALFGTGLKRNVEKLYAEAVSVMNDERNHVLSIDLPSGLNSDDGSIMGVCVQAKQTITLAFPKLGLFIGHGPELSGTIRIVDISIPDEGVKRLKGIPARLISEDQVKTIFSARKFQSHKGSQGHLLLVAGSKEKSGAAVMACHAALRAGAGLVTVAMPESAHPLIKPSLLEGMSEGLPEEEEESGVLGVRALKRLESILARKHVVGIGPGLNCDQRLGELIVNLALRLQVPLVIDADGLNALVGRMDSLRKAKAQVILTPHPGEMARLSGQKTEEVQADRIGVAQRFAKDFKVIVLLKGFRTVVAFPSGAIYINPTGNPGMATAGMGDVLTGMICAYLAQGVPSEEAVLGAVFNHGAAGDRVLAKKGDRGLIASDVIEEIPYLHASIYPHRDPKQPVVSGKLC